jgi:hypothetical protein
LRGFGSEDTPSMMRKRNWGSVALLRQSTANRAISWRYWRSRGPSAKFATKTSMS